MKPKMSRLRIASIICQYLVIALALAWMINAVTVHGQPHPQRRETWTRRDGFVAISVGGIARKPSETQLSREKLKELFQALSTAGFETITTRDIVNFYKNGDPLPDKPLYLMFEGGRKDGAIYGQENLSDTGMRATMYVFPRKMDEWTRTFLGRSEVATLYRSDFWEIGASAYDLYLPGTENLPRPHYYLTEYLKDQHGKSLETPGQFALRAEKDYLSSREALMKATRGTVSAYLFSPANSLGNVQSDDIDYVNSQLMAQYFDIAFTREGIGFNSRGSDPHRLTRLYIQPDMSPREVVARLGGWLAGGGPYRYSGREDSDRRWQMDSGSVDYRPEGIVLTPGRNHFAFSWLTGSEDWGDVDVRADVHHRPGREENIYLRYHSRQSFLRLRIADSGLTVQERTPERGITALAEAPLPESPAFTVHLTAKKNRLWVAAAGKNLTAEPLPFPGGLATGRVALEGRADAAGAPPTDDDDSAASLFQPTSRADAFAGESFRFGNLQVTPLALSLGPADLSRPLPLEWPKPEDPSGLLIPLDQPESGDRRAIPSYLLRALGQGLETYGVLREGSSDLAPLAAATAMAPPLLAAKLWSGVVFTYQPGMDPKALATAIEQAGKEGKRTVLRLTPADAEGFAASAFFPPVDWVLLKDDRLLTQSDADTPSPGPAVMQALERHYEKVLFWNEKTEGFDEKNNP